MVIRLGGVRLLADSFLYEVIVHDRPSRMVQEQVVSAQPRRTPHVVLEHDSPVQDDADGLR